MAKYVIREPRVGTVSLWCDRRRLGEFGSVQEAQRLALKVMDAKEDSLVHEEPDGYEYRLKGPRRRRWRAAPA